MIFKRQQCGICKKKIKKDEYVGELRLGTADGIHEIEICQECSLFLDQSAEVLARRKPSE